MRLRSGRIGESAPLEIERRPWEPYDAPALEMQLQARWLDRLGWRETDFLMEAQGGNPTAAMWPAHFSEKLPDGREDLHHHV
jgi:hypothetical protein